MSTTRREDEGVEFDAIIEDPKGATMRHRFDPATGEWRARPHASSTTPWPANYGFLPATLNPADGDELDTLVLADEPLPTGTQVRIRPIGLLLRPEDDHKVLSVVVDDRVYGSMRQLADVPERDIAAIERWFLEWSEHPGWDGAQAAVQLIARSRVPAQ